MAAIRPFRALRPPRELAARVAAPPYDVVDVAEGRRVADGNPDSFLHVSRPEIDLPDDTDPYADEVHRHGRATLEDLVARGVLVADEPALYVYRLRMGETEQTGLVGCTSVEEYRQGLIATHEHTRPDKESDRVRHEDVLDAHDEPVFLMHAPDAEVSRLVAEVTAGEPVYDLVTGDGVAHTLWRVGDPSAAERLIAAFARLPKLYVADGHHRSAAAARVADLRRERHGDAGEAEHFLSVVFPADQLTVLPYNRVVADLAGRSAAEFVTALDACFEVNPSAAPVQPAERRVIGMYLDGAWWHLRVRDGAADESDPIAGLDISVLQDRVLGPLLGIADPRTDGRIGFVGGIHGTGRLVELVDSGRWAVAFALFATSTAEVIAVADQGQVMPPKSTWFEPKLRSGLVLHPLS